MSLEFDQETLDLYEELYTEEPEVPKGLPEPEEPKSPGFVGSISRGIDQVQATLYGSAALAAGVTEKYAGIGKTVQDWGIAGYKRNLTEAELNAASVTFKEARGDYSKLPTWAIEQLGGVIPSMAEVAIMAVLGSVAAGPGAGTGAGAFAGRTVLKKAIKKAVDEQLKRELKGKVVDAAGKKILRDKIQRDVQKAAFKNLGAKFGVVAGVFPMEAGGNYAELLTEQGVDAPETAIATGIAATALEFVGGNIRLVDKFMPVGTASAFQKALKEGNSKFVKRAAKEILRQAPAEFAQEAGQEFLSAINVVANTDEKLLTPETGERILESGMVGLLAGTAGGTVSGIKSGGNVDKADIMVAQQIEGTPELTVEEKEELFDDMVKEQTGDRAETLADLPELEKEEIEIVTPDEIKSGMTVKQKERQETAKEGEARRQQIARDNQRKMEATMAAGEQQAQKTAQEGYEAKLTQKAKDQADIERRRTQQFMGAISTPQGLMNTVRNVLTAAKRAGDERSSLNVFRNVHKALETKNTNVKKLTEDLYDLQEVEAEAQDKYEKMLAGSLITEMTDRVAQLEEIERLKEQKKEAAAPATAAAIEKAKPTVAKRKITAEVKEAKKAEAAVVKKAKVAVTKKKIEAVKAKAPVKRKAVEPKLKVADIHDPASVLLKRKILLEKAKTPTERTKILEDFKPILRRLKKEGKLKYSEAAPSQVKDRTVSLGEREVHRTNIDKDLQSFKKYLKGTSTINVVKNVADAPKSIRDAVSRDKATPMALYDPNSKSIYVFSDMVKDPARAKFEAWHELGHYSFSELFGKEAANILNGIAAKFPDEVSRYAFNGPEEVLIQKFLANDKSTIVTKAKHLFRKLAAGLGMKDVITDHEVNIVVKTMRDNLAEVRNTVPEVKLSKESRKYYEDLEVKRQFVRTLERSGAMKYSEFIKEKGRVLPGSAAVKIDGKTYGPAQTHWEAYNMMPGFEDWFVTIDAADFKKRLQDGFLTDKGIFVTRKEAIDLVPKAVREGRSFEAGMLAEDLKYIGKTKEVKYSEVPNFLKLKAPGLPEGAKVPKKEIRTKAPAPVKRTPAEQAEVDRLIAEAKEEPVEVGIEHEGIVVGKYKTPAFTDKDIFYSQQFEVEETGETVTLKINATEALSKIEEDLFSLKVLRDCI